MVAITLLSMLATKTAFGDHYAIGAGLDDSELVLQGKYFINDRYYLTANYTESGSAELYNLKFVAQF